MDGERGPDRETEEKIERKFRPWRQEAPLAARMRPRRLEEFVGMPECQYNLAQACIHLAGAQKSNSTVAYFEALKTVREGEGTDVPGHLKDPSRDRKGLGHGAGYRYPHAVREHWVAQQYLPDQLQGQHFYQPGELGYERKIKERIELLRHPARDPIEGEQEPPGSRKPNR